MEFGTFLSVVNRMFKGGKVRLAFNVFMVGAAALMIAAAIVIKPVASPWVFWVAVLSGVLSLLAGVAVLVIEFFQALEPLANSVPATEVTRQVDPDDMPWYRQPRPNLGRLGVAIFAGSVTLFFVTPWGYHRMVLDGIEAFKAWTMVASSDPMLTDGFSRFMAMNFHLLALGLPCVVWFIISCWAFLELVHAGRAIVQASKSGFFRS